MTTALPTAPSAYGLNGPSAAVTVDNATPQGSTYLRGKTVRANGTSSGSFDTPAHLGNENQLFRGGIGWRGGQEVFRWLDFAVGPVDQQPLLGAHRGTQLIPVSRTNPHGGETGGKCRVGALPPSDRAAGLRRQVHGQHLHRNRFVTGFPTQPRRSYAATGPRLGWQRRSPRCPCRCRRANTHRVAQAQLPNAITKSGFVTITGARQHDHRYNRGQTRMVLT